MKVAAPIFVTSDDCRVLVGGQRLCGLGDSIGANDRCGENGDRRVRDLHCGLVVKYKAVLLTGN